MAGIEIRQMWKDGPVRNWSEANPSGKHWTPYDTGGFVGPYVCANCKKDVLGVYRVGNQWVGACCRANSNDKGQQ